MAQFSENRGQSRAVAALALTAALMLAPNWAHAQLLSYAPAPSAFPAEDGMTLASPDDEAAPSAAMPERLRRTVVGYDTREAPGTVVIDTGHTALYYVLGQGR